MSKLYRRDGSKEDVELVYSRVKYEGDMHTLFFIRNAMALAEARLDTFEAE